TLLERSAGLAASAWLTHARHAADRTAAAGRGAGRKASCRAWDRPGQGERGRRLRRRRFVAGPGDENLCPGSRGGASGRRRIGLPPAHRRSSRRRPAARRKARSRHSNGVPAPRSSASRSRGPSRGQTRSGGMIALLLASAAVAFPEEKQSTPEERAIAYLAREVPRWSAKNK